MKPLHWMLQRIAALTAFLAITGCVRADNFLVLPFFNLSSDRNLDWIGDSLAESIRDALASEGLVALDRPARNDAFERLSIQPYTVLTKATVVKIGQELDAEEVIYGSFQVTPVDNGREKSRGSLQVSAYVLDLKHMKQGSQFGELGPLEDLSSLQRHLSWTTLQVVMGKRAPYEAEFSRRHPAVRVDAMENYIRGLAVTNLSEKHRLFTQAVRLDSHFTQPCFELGKLDMARKEFRSAAEWFQKVTPDDVHYREATFFLGLSLYYIGDFLNAKLAFQSVAAVVPLNEVLNNFGAAESRRNEPEAVDSFKKALDGDESDPTYHFNVGYALWKQARFEEAANRFRAVLDRNPKDEEARALLERCLKRSGPRPGDTKTEGLERVKTNYSESAWWQLKAALSK